MKTIAVLLLCLGLLAAAYGEEPRTPEKASPKAAKDKEPAKKAGSGETKRKPHFTVGKDTTFVTEPLDADGYIDYATALNKRMRKGITPANNANVLIWKALGPHPEGATMSAEFFKWLEIEPLPERGDYFIPMLHFLRDKLKLDPLKDAKDIYDEQQICWQGTWKASEHPCIAAWLKANEKPLALILEASKRTHYFSPLVPKRTKKGSSGLIGALLPSVQKCREVASALAARAMLCLGEGRSKDAWQDLLACHRLGRLVAHGGTLIEALVGIAIDAVAGRADLVFLAKADLKTEQIRACLQDLRKLPPMPPIADKVDLGERFMFLDIVMMVDRGGLQVMEALSGGTPKEPDTLTKIMQFFIQNNLDWDPALRNANRWYDRLAKAMRGKDRATRVKELNKLETELKELKVKTQKSMGSLFAILPTKRNREMIGEQVGNILISLLLPAVSKVQAAHDRCEQLQTNLYVAFALAAYQHDHNRYPKELEALAPKYLDRIPNDTFSGKPLIYRPAANGYLLYSLGVNGRDEEGHSWDDDPRGDDLTVRMPPPKPERK
ncbi:MAG TPA: hypothetical protein VMG10_15735 [Gemmataceae bacterium]|nr:hypothetical protein [Gemmataceae bacterium]